MNFNLYDMVDFVRLESVYNQIRVLQAKHNKLETRCIGSGECCKIGLRLPIIECAYIAYSLRREYFLLAENKGSDVADEWWSELIEKIKSAFYDETYQEHGDTERHCVFYNKGCSIYPFRPFVCRSYGVTTAVDPFCPRKRLPDGKSIDVFRGESVKQLVRDFIDIYESFGKRHEDVNYSVFMPLGVLNFLLSEDELDELRENTDTKFWRVAREYKLAFVDAILRGITVEEVRQERDNE